MKPDATGEQKIEEMKILKMALGNTAACLGDALATFNKLAGEEVFKNASTASEKVDPNPYPWCEKTGAPCDGTHLCHFPNCQETPSATLPKKLGVKSDSAQDIGQPDDKSSRSPLEQMVDYYAAEKLTGDDVNPHSAEGFRNDCILISRAIKEGAFAESATLTKQVVGRVWHIDGEVVANLNSEGKKLADDTPLYVTGEVLKA